MRTTIDLPDDLHRIALSIAHDRHQSLSQTVADLLRRAIGDVEAVSVHPSPRTGLPVVDLGRFVTAEDVRSLEDE